MRDAIKDDDQSSSLREQAVVSILLINPIGVLNIKTL